MQRDLFKTEQELYRAPAPVMSYGYDQHKILKDIIHLHIPEGKIQCDATYGYGSFYKKIPLPEYCYDQEPKKVEAVKADCRNLPHEKNTLNSIIFDPPFIITDHKTSDEYLMFQRFSGFKLISDLRTMYAASFVEFNRILKPGGRLIVKCQDITHGKKNYFIHNEVMNMVTASGFIPLDLFVLCNKSRFKGNVKLQRTARKHHCYFLVFKKRSRKSASGERVL